MQGLVRLSHYQVRRFGPDLSYKIPVHPCLFVGKLTLFPGPAIRFPATPQKPEGNFENWLTMTAATTTAVSPTHSATAVKSATTHSTAVEATHTAAMKSAHTAAAMETTAHTRK
jgi:hypothetical protein